METYLSHGCDGDNVVYLQECLNSFGYDLDVDGIFGDDTQEAVEDFQSAQGLEADGIVGSMTWDAIQNILASFEPAC
ncbi:peptidoglycan-binding domain-containing protein [Brunnivagina elsteri]|uniref:Peptidoglycan-binding protein n=1 Tax=Brunnivagina elsteri CCALA 953 TaxID=987040 RepID=A0A2A2TQC9_9CYAN|nr:peptidoglycan-binding domain-containing protein [Calothrix elsteri]PAX60746.1 peptidoglycan-binding protein [Calothrix elsteri CCALA 953]